jgi:hypothetical protein
MPAERQPRKGLNQFIVATRAAGGGATVAHK